MANVLFLPNERIRHYRLWRKRAAVLPIILQTTILQHIIYADILLILRLISLSRRFFASRRHAIITFPREVPSFLKAAFSFSQLSPCRACRLPRRIGVSSIMIARVYFRAKGTSSPVTRRRIIDRRAPSASEAMLATIRLPYFQNLQ